MLPEDTWNSVRCRYERAVGFTLHTETQEIHDITARTLNQAQANTYMRLVRHTLARSVHSALRPDSQLNPQNTQRTHIHAG